MIEWRRSLDRHQYMLAAIAMAVLLAVFFKPVAFDHATFSAVDVNQRNAYPWAQLGDRPPFPAQTDQAQYSYPRQVFLDHALKHDGAIPLWDPFTLGGHPSFASGPGMAYPPRLVLTLLFDPSWTHDLYVILHIFGAGMAMFAFMKQLRVAFLGALLGAVAWSFSSYSLGWITLEPFAAVAALLPLALLLVRRWYDRESWAQLLLASLVLGLAYLGSSSELALVSFLLVAGYAAALALRRAVAWGPRSAVGRVASVGAPLVLVGLALGVAAVGVLPFLELMGRVDRAGIRYADYLTSTYPTLRRTSLADLLRTFVPPTTPLSPARLTSQSAFVGTATALLAVPALFIRRPGTGFGRAAAAITLLFVVGTPVTWIGYHLVPGLGSLNGLARCLFVWNLGVAVLGGIGLDAAVTRLGRTAGSTGPRARLGGRLPVVLRTLGVLCVVATAGQLLVYGWHANPPFQPRDRGSLFPRTPAVAALQQAQGPAPGEQRALPLARLVGGRPPRDGSPFLAMPGNAGQALDLRLVTGYENAVPDRTLQLWRYLRGEDLEAVLSVPPTTTLNLVFPSDRVRTELLGRVGVGAVLAPPGLVEDAGWRQPDLRRKGLRLAYLGSDGVVLAVDGAAPRASVVSASRVVQGSRAALSALIEPGFDPARTVILESSPVAPDVQPAISSEAARVVWLDQGPNGARLSVTAANPSWLIIRESWDPGWRAMVGGRAAKVERADFAFQAIRVPAGTSAVELAYRPPELFRGAAVSGVTTAAILAVAITDAGRRRRRRRTGRRSGGHPT